MRKYRKVTALAMSSAMVLAALAGCAGGIGKDETTTAAEVYTTADQTTQAPTEGTKAPTEATTEKPTEAPTEAPTKWEGPITAFKDGTIEIVTGKKAELDSSWRGGLLVLSGKIEPKNQYQEDLRDWLHYELEDENRVSVQLKSMDRDPSSYAAGLTASIAAGAPMGHLCEIDARWIPALINNHLATPLDSLSALDLTDAKWNQGVIEATSFGGHIYGINADNEPGYGVFFNKRILQEAGYGENDLYDHQKNGTWNRAKFEEVLKACTKDTNGDGKTDIWGLTTSLGANYYTAMVYASEAAFVTKDASGQFANQMGSEEFLSALSWAEEVRKEYGAPPTEDPTGMVSYTDRFINGEVAMMVANESDIQYLSSMKDDWGFVMIPCPDGELLVAVDPSPVVFIPASFSKEEANEIAYVFDLVTNPLPCLDGDYWKESYYGEYRDSRAVDETLQIMKRGINIKPRLELFVQDLYHNSVMNDFLYPLFAGETTPEEGIKANLEKWNTCIKEQNNALKKLGR